jgi:hypothetical protein
MQRHELTDEQWRHIEPLLPRHGRRSTRGDLSFSFANWSKGGPFERIFKAVRLEVDKRGSLLDATIARAHQDAVGGKGGSDAMLWDALGEVFDQAPCGRRLSGAASLCRADAGPATRSDRGFSACRTRTRQGVHRRCWLRCGPQPPSHPQPRHEGRQSSNPTCRRIRRYDKKLYRHRGVEASRWGISSLFPCSPSVK